MDVAKMVARGDAVVKQNNDGILYLFKKNKVTVLPRPRRLRRRQGRRLPDRLWRSVQHVHGARHVIIATGSNARALPGVAFDEEPGPFNDGALRIESVPEEAGRHRFRA